MPNEMIRFFKDTFRYAHTEKNTQKRLYHYSTLTSFFIILFFVIPAKIFISPAMSLWTIVFFAIASFFSLWLHLRSRKGEMYPMVFMFVLGISFFCVGVLNGGRDGPIPFLFYYDYVLMFVIVQDNWKRMVMIVFHLSLALGLQISDVLFPMFYTAYSNDTSRSMDTTLTYIGGYILIGILQTQILKTQILLEKDYKFKLKKLEKEKEIDKLTGCFSKDGTERTLRELIDYEKKTSSDFDLTIIMADIDFFKKVNDTYGHLIGDELLSLLGKILISSFRKSDYIGRVGGEEFLIILPKANLSEAIDLAETVRKNIISKNYTKNEIKISMSFGITTIQEEDTYESFVSRCDSLLYMSKKNGRNRVTAG